MKLIITTSDIRVEYEDEYSQITDEAKKRIIEIIREVQPLRIVDLKPTITQQQWDPKLKQH